MEAAFGVNFADVRIHDDAHAAGSAETLGAAAYTVGSHIAFASGQYAWNSNGRAVLAHELAHVVQQHGAGQPSRLALGAAVAEPEADRVSASLVDGWPAEGVATRISHHPVGLSCRGLSPSTDRLARPDRKRAVSAPEEPKTTVERFGAYMATEFGVESVRVGTEAEQERHFARPDEQPKLPNWRLWEPTGAQLQMIEDGFDDVERAFGGIPRVREIVFFDKPYTLDEAGAIVEDNAAASFGDGTLTIYRSLVTGVYPLPVARSDPSGRYEEPGRFEERGSVPGAPMNTESQQESAARQIGHELGHAMAEMAEKPRARRSAEPAMADLAALGAAPTMTPAESSSGVDPALMTDFMLAVGWVAGELFDIGVPAVAEAMAAGNPPPAQYRITGADWNHPKWVEQPVSSYAVRGGPDEDFAESYMAYVQQPNVLQARSPRRFAFIRDRAARWAPRLVKRRRLGDFPVPRNGSRPA